jgi:spermidine synthase
LEIVLLLAFQVLCGSVYHQVGVIVTLFMVGLAFGSFVMNRQMPRAAKKSLACLAFAVGVYAILLPLLLPWLNQMGGTASSLFAVKAVIALLTLVLATLAGMQFPLANRLEFDGSVASASRLYTADFVGAFLGALLASTLLIPLIGVTGVCLVTAGLNILGGIVLQWRKAAT